MIFRRKSARYTVIPSALLEDSRLSWEEKGLLAYLLSKPDTWEVSAAHLVNCGTAGRDKVYRMLKNLQRQGYLQQQKKKTGHVEWHIYDTPNPDPEKPDQDEPDPEKPDQEKPDLENPTLVNTEFKVNTDYKNNNIHAYSTKQASIDWNTTRQPLKHSTFHSPIPDTLLPDPKTQIAALNLGIPGEQLPEIAEDYLDWLRAEGRTCADYQAGLRRWIKVWKKRNPASRGAQPGVKMMNSSGGHSGQSRGFSQRKLTPAERCQRFEEELRRRYAEEECTLEGEFTAEERGDLKVMDQNGADVRTPLGLSLWGDV